MNRLEHRIRTVLKPLERAFRRILWGLLLVPLAVIDNLLVLFTLAAAIILLGWVVSVPVNLFKENPSWPTFELGKNLAKLAENHESGIWILSGRFMAKLHI
jgi:hypothetical protein